ncbi:hypothetical protein [Denitrobaculum tricleocarpae]|uniref:Uncharacterized protein n=1 Tax=Denitrobaculum tricleocarpae TaxID=2591009 RepID=A0A545TP54_9PROT|nr:hypothetical protein [Denitrobaculum tricleocarpae]TQV79002.1 hypothetical protein FKG95_15060 [Denitrobaculum tricleocarpae]
MEPDFTGGRGRSLTWSGMTAALGGLVLLAFFLVLSMPAKAEARSLEAVAAEIASRYDVEVLRSSEVVLADGSSAYELVVMRPGGNSNAAFQVTRLLADPESGDLIPAFRHGRSGYDLSGAPRFNPGRDGADYIMRRDSLR